jgi:chemotaxis protein MotB
VLINFLDNPSEPVFEKDSPDFTEYGAWIFNTIAWEIARYPTTQIELEGHTEEGFQKIRKDYGSWEISVDRANSARRRLLSQGVKPSQIIKVAGFGGSKPLKDRNSVDPSNRRVTVMLRAGKDPN